MKPLQNAYEKVRNIVSSSGEKGLDLIKKAGFGTLVLATLASCQKDDVEPITENQIPTVETNLDNVDSTSANVFVNFEDVDGEVVSGTYYLTRFNPVAKIMGDTPFTAEQIKAGNLDGFNLKFDNLQPDTDYKLVIEAVTDNEGAEAQIVEVEFKTETGADTPEPVYEYTTNTELNEYVTNWSDIANGNTIPAGTVLSMIQNQSEVKKDGISQGVTGASVSYELQGIDADKLEIVGKEVRVKENLLIDNTNGTTNITVANDIDYTVKTILKDTDKQQIQAEDSDNGKLDVEDKANVHFFENPQGGQILVENINGDLFQDYVDAGINYSTNSGISINSGGYIQIANASNGRFNYQTVDTYPDVQFTSGIHTGKSLHMEKIEKIKGVLGQMLVDNGIPNDETSLNHNIFGIIISQLSDNDFEDYNGTSVKIKDEVINKVCGTIVVARLNEMGITVE